MQHINFGVFDSWYEAVEIALKDRYFSLNLIKDKNQLPVLNLYVEGVNSIFHIEIDQGSAMPTKLERAIDRAVELNKMEEKALREVESYGVSS